MADETYGARLFDVKSVQQTATSTGQIATNTKTVASNLQAVGKAASYLVQQLESAYAWVLKIKKENLALPTGKSGGIHSSGQKDQSLGYTAGAHTGVGGVSQGNALASSITSSISGLTSTLETSFRNLPIALNKIFTNLFGGKSTAGPSVGGYQQQVLPGLGGGGGGGGTGGGSGGGINWTAGMGASALAGAAALGNIAQKSATVGTQWTTGAMSIIPFAANATPGQGAFGQNAMQAGVKSMVNQAKTGVIWGGDIGALSGAEAALIGSHGATYGSAAYQGQLAQASASGLTTGQGLLAGAQGQAWLGTAAGRNFMYTIGLNPNDPKNQNITGAAENIAAKLNGGIFPSKQKLQAMIGPGQPLTNTLYYLVGNMGMPNQDSVVDHLKAVLLAEAKTEVGTGANMTYVSIGAQTTAAGVAGATAALGLSGKGAAPQIKTAQAAGMVQGAWAKGNVSTAYSAAEATWLKAVASKWIGDTLNPLQGILGALSAVFGQLLGPAKGLLTMLIDYKIVNGVLKYVPRIGGKVAKAGAGDTAKAGAGDTAEAGAGDTVGDTSAAAANDTVAATASAAASSAAILAVSAIAEGVGGIISGRKSGVFGYLPWQNLNKKNSKYMTATQVASAMSSYVKWASGVMPTPEGRVGAAIGEARKLLSLGVSPAAVAQGMKDLGIAPNQIGLTGVYSQTPSKSVTMHLNKGAIQINVQTLDAGQNAEKAAEAIVTQIVRQMEKELAVNK